jgi:formate/nitrite transporter
MNFMTPAEIAAATANAGKAKCELPIMKMLLLGILAGAYIGFGANLATKIGSMESAGTASGQFLFGAVFSVGLMMVVIAGSELFTGNCLFCPISVINGQASWGGLLKNWVVVFIANFIGSLLLVYIIYYGGFWADATTATGISAHGIKALGIAKSKLSLTFGQAFFRGICCNWLVCLAVWMAFAAKDIAGKIFAIFFPIMAFVSSGFEHSVANMFFIPMGISIANGAAQGVATATTVNKAGEVVPLFKDLVTPDAVTSFFTYGHFINANLIPVTLGNIVGGAIFVGCIYWFCYLKK